MSETNKTKKRQAPDASLEWTDTLTRFMKEQLQEFLNLNSSSQSGSSSGLVGNDLDGPDKAYGLSHTIKYYIRMR